MIDVVAILSRTVVVVVALCFYRSMPKRDKKKRWCWWWPAPYPLSSSSTPNVRFFTNFLRHVFFCGWRGGGPVASPPPSNVCLESLGHIVTGKWCFTPRMSIFLHALGLSTFAFGSFRSPQHRTLSRYQSLRLRIAIHLRIGFYGLALGCSEFVPITLVRYALLCFNHSGQLMQFIQHPPACVIHNRRSKVIKLVLDLAKYCWPDWLPVHR